MQDTVDSAITIQIDTNALADLIAKRLTKVNAAPPPRSNGKPFAALRGEMKRQGVEHAYLNVKLGRGANYVSRRMNGAAPWTLEDIHNIMRLLNLPVDQMHIYFPPDHKKEPRKSAAK